MLDNSTTKIIEPYFKRSSPALHFSRDFTSKPKHFYRTQKVSIDIKRSGKPMAIAVTDIADGHRLNSHEQYTVKEFTAPVYKEKIAVNAYNLSQRFPGENPHDNPDYQAHANVLAFDGMRETEDKIIRAVEHQGSQIYQTGRVDLYDLQGGIQQSLDFKAKASHFPTVAVVWGQPGDNILGDLRMTISVIKKDGQKRPTKIRFGSSAWEKFLEDATVIEMMNSRRMKLGEVAPVEKEDGATYQGYIWLGGYKMELWTYDGSYDHPQTGVDTEYLSTGNVVISTEKARLDATWGAVPRLAPTELRAARFLPNRFSDKARGMDLFVNAWFSESGEDLFVGTSSRPLFIPTDIDSFACIDTGLN